jgi:hypothetical protein
MCYDQGVKSPVCVSKRLWKSLPRPYDLHSAQTKKSDDLDNACAKSRVLEALLAQAVAMQIISTPGMSRAWKRERRQERTL